MLALVLTGDGSRRGLYNQFPKSNDIFDVPLQALKMGNGMAEKTRRTKVTKRMIIFNDLFPEATNY